MADWLLQDLHATNCESPADGYVYVPACLLGMGEAGDR